MATIDSGDLDTLLSLQSNLDHHARSVRAFADCSIVVFEHKKLPLGTPVTCYRVTGLPYMNAEVANALDTAIVDMTGSRHFGVVEFLPELEVLVYPDDVRAAVLQNPGLAHDNGWALTSVMNNAVRLRSYDTIKRPLRSFLLSVYRASGTAQVMQLTVEASTRNSGYVNLNVILGSGHRVPLASVVAMARERVVADVIFAPAQMTVSAAQRRAGPAAEATHGKKSRQPSAVYSTSRYAVCIRISELNCPHASSGGE